VIPLYYFAMFLKEMQIRGKVYLKSPLIPLYERGTHERGQLTGQAGDGAMAAWVRKDRNRRGWAGFQPSQYLTYVYVIIIQNRKREIIWMVGLSSLDKGNWVS